MARAKSLRALLRGSAWAMVTVLVCLLSVTLHLDTALSRRVVRDELLAYVNANIRGRLFIEAFEVLRPWDVRARGVVLYDAQRQPIIRAARLATAIDLLALLQHTLRFSKAHLRDGSVTLRPDAEGDPTLFSAFDLTQPRRKRTGKPLRIVIDDLHTRSFRLEGELLGLKGLLLRDVHAHGRIQIEGNLDIDVWSTRATMVRPFPFAVHIDQVAGKVHSDKRRGIKLFTRLHTASDRLSATLRYWRPHPGRPSELDLQALADPLWLPRLQDLRFGWAARLHGTARGVFRLWGPPKNLRFHTDAETTAGPLRVDAQLPHRGAIDLQVASSGLLLGQLVRGAPAWTLAARGALHVPAPTMQGDPTVKLDIEPWLYKRYPIPALRIEGSVGDEVFILHRAQLPKMAGDLRATGRIAYSGDADLRVRGGVADIAADRHLRRYLPEVRGALHIDARLQARAQPRSSWLGTGSLTATGLRYGPLAAQQLSLQGSVRQTGAALRIDSELRSRSLILGRYRVGDGALTLRGNDPDFRLAGRFVERQGRSLALDVELHRAANGYELRAPNLELGLGPQQLWRGEAQAVKIALGRSIDIGVFRLASGSQRLEVHGHLDLQGQSSDVEALLQDLDMRVLRGLLGDRAPQGGGKVDARWLLRGDLARPDLMLQGALREGSFGEMRGVEAVYLVHLLAGHLELDVQVEVGDRGKLSLTGGGLTDGKAKTLTEQLMGGAYELEAQTEALDLRLLRSLPGLATWAVQGRLSGRLTARGSPQAPTLQAEFQVPSLRLPGWSPLTLHTWAEYELGVLAARLALADAHGPWLESEGSVLIDLMQAVQHPRDTLATLATVPWRFAIRTPARLLEQLPQPLRDRIPPALRPLRVAANATLTGGAFEPRGELQAAVDWYGHLRGLGCGGIELPPHADLRLVLRDGMTRALGQAFIGAQRVIDVQAEAATPLARWAADLARRRFQPPSLQVRARLQRAPLQRVPGLCRYAGGRVDATLEGDRLWTPQAHFRLQMSAPDLQLRRVRDALRSKVAVVEAESPPMQTQLSAEIDRQALRANATMQWAQGAGAVLRALIPVQWSSDHAVPWPRFDAPLQIDAQVKRAPLATFVAWVPQLVEVGGDVSGQLQMRGLLPVPSVRGDLRLRHGELRLYGLGHRLHDLQGKVLFQNRRVQLEGLRARDAKGTLRLDGSMEFADQGKARARLVLRPENFPLRREAAVIGTVSGEALLDSRWDAEQLSANLVVRRLAVQIPDDASSDLQGLDHHPDVRVFGEEVPSITDKAYAMRLFLDAGRPFWVRSSTYRIEMRTEVLALYRDPELTLRGYAELLRGRVEIYGKRFDIERGSIDFDGGTTIDPEVSLVLTHRLRNPQGATVSVIVAGRLSKPVIRFASSETSDQAEIIGLLVGGRNTRGAVASTPAVSQQVGNETAAFLTGLTYGLASLTARKQLGELFPVVSIENNASVYGGSRARVGFQADEIIPPRLRNFVRGAYLEGSTSLSSGQRNFANTGAVQGRGLGFLLQLEFPHSIFGSGAFAPPDNWGLDLTWEP